MEKNIVNAINISIAICTINPESCLRLLESLIGYIQNDDQIIVILDGQQYLSDNSCDFIEFCEANKICLYINIDNKGLSYCRNKIMMLASNDYLLFFDDDTVLINNIIDQFRQQFQNGKNIGGAKLIFPENYKRKIFFLPDGYSYLFGVHYKEDKIWGACFGFDKKIALIHNLLFDERLGRKNRSLQSGDDTFFVKEYLKISNKSFFIQEPVMHLFDRKRLRLKYIVRRVFWQGRSEIRRCNFREGWSKECCRSASYINLIQLIVTLLLRMIFLMGCLWECIMVRLGR